MLDIDSLGEQPKDVTDYSYYLTRLLNSCMGELCLAQARGSDTCFRLTGALTPEQREELCDLLCIIFDKSVRHKEIRHNLHEYTKRNKYDLYFRFLLYLSEWKLPRLFNSLCLSLVLLLSKTQYTLPMLYRQLSLYLLSKECANQSFFVPIALCKLVKYFSYTPGQKKLMVDIMESVIIEKKSRFVNRLDDRKAAVDRYIIKNNILLLFDDQLIEREKNKRLEEEAAKTQPTSTERDIEEGTIRTKGKGKKAAAKSKDKSKTKEKSKSKAKEKSKSKAKKGGDEEERDEEEDELIKKKGKKKDKAAKKASPEPEPEKKKEKKKGKSKSPEKKGKEIADSPPKKKGVRGKSTSKLPKDGAEAGADPTDGEEEEAPDEGAEEEAAIEAGEGQEEGLDERDREDIGDEGDDASQGEKPKLESVSQIATAAPLDDSLLDEEDIGTEPVDLEVFMFAEGGPAGLNQPEAAPKFAYESSAGLTSDLGRRPCPQTQARVRFHGLSRKRLRVQRALAGGLQVLQAVRRLPLDEPRRVRRRQH